jgi:hypothetical protein
MLSQHQEAGDANTALGLAAWVKTYGLFDGDEEMVEDVCRYEVGDGWGSWRCKQMRQG